MKTNKKYTKKAFTLLEILLVIAAIGILAAIVIVAINPQRQLALVRETQIQSGQNTVKNALDQYLLNEGEYPITADSPQQVLCNNTITTNCLDITSALSPDYIASIPSDASYVLYTNHTADRVFVDRTEARELLNCPTGYVPVPGSSLYGTEDFCVMKYHAKNIGGVATSQIAGTPWVNITLANARTQCSNVGAQLLNNAQWMTIARNLEGVGANWTSGTVGTGGLWRGHTDNSPANALVAATDDNPYFGTGNAAPSIERRTFTLSNGEVLWDFSGNVIHRLDDTIIGSAKPNTGASGAFWQQWTLFTDSSQYRSLNYDLIRASNPTWNNTSQNIGNYYGGDVSSGASASYLRGGAWSSGANAGIFTISFGVNPDSTDSRFGFRCVIIPGA